MKKIDFIFFDAGGGHRSAANALKAVIEQQGRPWEIRLVNLQEVLDPLDIFRKITGIRMQDVYNHMLKRGWTLGSPALLPLMHGVIRTYHRGAVRLLKQYWSGRGSDLVVSLVPNFNRAMFEGLRAAGSRAPYVTILTDFADYPPHFWMEKQEQFFVCGTPKAVEQARAMGHPPERIFSTSGMILRPAFYQTVEIDRSAAREKLGLKPDLPTGLVLFGGEGSSAMVQVAREVERLNAAVQLIFICGKNGKLRRRLEDMKTRFPKYVEGFTTEVPRYMTLADFFIGKPGPGSLSEALAMRLPVLVERNAWTLVQERYNTQWIVEKGAGIVVPSLRRASDGFRRLLEPAIYSRFRANVEAIDNRAVFEIPEILERLMIDPPARREPSLRGS